jgi:uncharacterized protein
MTPNGVFTSSQLAERQLPPGAEEELAGPPTMHGPATRQKRLSSLDVLRGVGVLGILVMNIDDFGIPEAFHDIPVGSPIDNFFGPHARLNLLVLIFKWVFFEGKMRGLFSMLFGAGVILMTSRAEQRGAGNQIADIYLRRNMLLVLFGLLHGCLIWEGDILFLYGMAALLFLYPCRHMKPKTLLLLGVMLAVPVCTFFTFVYTGGVDDLNMSRQAAAISAREKAGQPISAQDKKIEQAWHARLESQRVTPQTIQAAMATARQGYVQSINTRLQGFFGPNAAFTNFFFTIEALSAMLIGMALFKVGFMTGEMPYATYAWTAVVGFSIYVPITVVGILKAYAGGFDFFTNETRIFGPYFFDRVVGMVAITSLLVMAIKSRVFPGLQKRLAAVGKTALSNYLLTSLLCQFLFLWGPWKLYGKLEYYQLNYVLVAIWFLNLTISPLWLRYFEFGPFEWVWRSLTYLKPQAMRVEKVG